MKLDMSAGEKHDLSSSVSRKVGGEDNGTYFPGNPPSVEIFDAATKAQLPLAALGRVRI